MKTRSIPYNFYPAPPPIRPCALPAKMRQSYTVDRAALVEVERVVKARILAQWAKECAA